MRHDSFRRNAAPKAKKPDKTVQGVQLLPRGASPREIADQADADSMLVVVVVRRLAVGAVFLEVPTRADLDDAVPGFRTVADDEMIAQPVPTLLTVVFVKRLGAAPWRGAVVNDDRGPARTDTPGTRVPCAGQ